MKKQTNHPSHKRRYIIITLASVVLIALVARILYYAHDQQQLASLHKDIQSTHTSLGVIAHNLEGQTKTSWSDVSECYRTKPRLFGDEYKYDCDVKYISSSKSVNLANLDTILRSTKVNGQVIDFGQGSKINGHQSYTAQLYTSKDLDTCSLRYEYDTQKEMFDGNLSCYYSLTESQFDAVSGVLPAGNDRT